MNIIVLKNNLREGLGVLEHAIAENNNLPVLRNVLLKTANNRIQLKATNLEIGVTTNIPGKIVEEGALTVPFAALYSVISNIQSERIDLASKNNTLHITTDNYDAKIQGIPESDFPIIPQLASGNAHIEIEPGSLRDALGQVALAAQESEVMPEISGVLLLTSNDECKLVATDSFRLAEKTLFKNQYACTTENGARAIIPLKTVQEVLRAFPASGTVRVSLDQNQILFKNEHTELISRIIDGTYPDYEHIIPSAKETEVFVERESFLRAIKLVSSFSGKNNDVRVNVDNGKKTLEAYSANQLLGENNYLIPAKIKGADVKGVSFNWRYLADGLKALRGTQAVFTVNGESKPAVLQSPDDASYVYVVMPIRSA
ncbi:MAG: DNA polymerase III subunit beta [Candidatus Harrisonbacteria bacterium]|nr:DNA polymerase III subunit beta [Candidatus Harrisonbacteria bacterium]